MEVLRLVHWNFLAAVVEGVELEVHFLAVMEVVEERLTEARGEVGEHLIEEAVVGAVVRCLLMVVEGQDECWTVAVEGAHQMDQMEFLEVMAEEEVHW